MYKSDSQWFLKFYNAQCLHLLFVVLLYFCLFVLLCFLSRVGIKFAVYDFAYLTKFTKTCAKSSMWFWIDSWINKKKVRPRCCCFLCPRVVFSSSFLLLLLFCFPAESHKHTHTHTHHRNTVYFCKVLVRLLKQVWSWLRQRVYLGLGCGFQERSGITTFKNLILYICLNKTLGYEHMFI